MERLTEFSNKKEKRHILNVTKQRYFLCPYLPLKFGLKRTEIVKNLRANRSKFHVLQLTVKFSLFRTRLPGEKSILSPIR
jgi:hypothetical protein